MEETIKKVISLYTKISVDEINAQTVIDRTAVSSSILLHRMYGHLANEGITIDNYWDIKTYGVLMQRINEKQAGSSFTPLPELISTIAEIDTFNSGIGIDIQEINVLPVSNDFREDEFYKMNFTSAEIAYCILQKNPRVSFAGLFAAKEAIVKADNTFLNKPFNAIQLEHLPNGKPYNSQFKISISHTEEIAIAVAIKELSKITETTQHPKDVLTQFPAIRQKKIFFWLLILSLLLSLIAIFICIRK